MEKNPEQLTDYESVKNMTDEEYFNGNEFAINAFKKKYAITENETYVQAVWRVVNAVASVEKTKELQQYWAKRWFSEIFNDWWKPGGSIMSGAGIENSAVSLANCNTLSLGNIDPDNEWDNLESIIRNLAYSVAKSAAYRQGLGVDFSRLRPRNSVIKNSAEISSGAVHWMDFIDKIGYYVGQSGRIPAFLFSMSIKHPDIEEFITVKKDYTRIQNANISVQVTNDFYKAVEADEMWELKFIIPAIKKGQKIYIDKYSATDQSLKDEKGYYYISTKDRDEEIIVKYVPARKLFRLIAENMWKNAEPGIQNIEIAREYSNSDAVYDPKAEYDSRIMSTNACSEQYLSRDSVCVLGSLVMSTFSTDPEKYQKELDVIAPSINRFLDNVNELELRNKTYYSDMQRLAIQYLRRIGAGITDIGGWLIKANYAYGSTEGNIAVEEFQKYFNYKLYKSTEELGKEKGSFLLFDKNKINKSKFIQNLKQAFPDLKLDNMRNVTLSSIAPTGCIHKDSYIITDKGIKQIGLLGSPKEKQFKDLNNLKVYKDYDLTKSSKATKLYNNGKVPGKKITLANGIILRVSNNHPLLIFDSNRVENNIEFRPAEEISIYDGIVTALPKPVEVGEIQKLQPINGFSNELTEDIAFAAGYISMYLFYGDVNSPQPKLKNIKGALDDKEIINHKFLEYLSKNYLFGTIPPEIFASPLNIRKAYIKGLVERHIDPTQLNFTPEPYETKKTYIKSLKSRITLLNKNQLNKVNKLYISNLILLLNSIGISNFTHYNPANLNYIEALEIDYITSDKKSLDYLFNLSNNKSYNKISWLFDLISHEILDKRIIIRSNFVEKLANTPLYNTFNIQLLYSGNIVPRNKAHQIFYIPLKVNELNLAHKHFKSIFGYDFINNFYNHKIIKIEDDYFETYDIEVDNVHHSYVLLGNITSHNTLSLMARKSLISYGVEPSFGLYYWKRTRLSGEYKYYFIVPSVVRELFEKNGIKLPIKSDIIEDTWDGKKGKKVAEIIEQNKAKINLNFIKASDVDPLYKMDLMSRLMKWIDSSISVTYLLKEDTPIDKIEQFIMTAFKKGVKSISAFPDKQMYGIISDIPFKELAQKLISQGVNIHPQNFSEKEQKELLLHNNNVTISIAPKRPKILKADIYQILVKGEKFLIAIGLYNGVPYEAFGGKIYKEFDLTFKYKTGTIIKRKVNKQNIYDLMINISEGKRELIENFAQKFNPGEQNIFRLISAMLRHGIPIKFIVDQLSKMSDNMFSLSASVSRVLKKYIKDGEIVTGKACPVCNSTDLVYKDGCITCASCGWSKCD